MRILLVTPLYPPDIAPPAPYVKELASRIKENHEVTVLSYNYIPEEMDGVFCRTIQKHLPLSIRLMRFAWTLWKDSRSADIVYVQNGPSTELPSLLVALFARRPYILHLGDETALRQASEHFLFRMLLKSAIHHAESVVIHSKTSAYTAPFQSHLRKFIDLDRPLARPEILPFAPHPTEAFIAYESSWQLHIQSLISFFAS